MQRYPEAQDEVAAVFCRAGLKAVGEIGAWSQRGRMPLDLSLVFG
jgi:hypothetical protein